MFLQTDLNRKVLNYLTILTFIFGIIPISVAQINPFEGIIDVDSCDFSQNCSYIQLDTNSLWQIGHSNKTFLQPNSAQNVLITDTSANYPIHAESSFEIHWPAHENSIFNFILSFDHSMDSDSSHDGGRIEISYDYGQTWVDIYDDAITNVAFNTENFYSQSDTLYDGKAGFSGHFSNRHSVLQWVWIIPLKSFPTDTMYYRFSFKSDSLDHNKEGWLIENIHFAFADMQGGISTEPVSYFELSPNPSSEVVQIQTALKEFELAIYALNGTQIESFGNEKTLNVSGFSPGVYLLQMLTPEGKTSTKKLLID
jgi:hypothetical protein